MASSESKSVRSDFILLGCAGLLFMGASIAAVLLVKGMVGTDTGDSEPAEAGMYEAELRQVRIVLEDSFSDTTASGRHRENAVRREWVSFGVYGGSQQDATYLRFPISLLGDEEIDFATLQFRCSGDRKQWGEGRSTVRIYLLDSDNQGPFATGSYPNHEALNRIPVSGTYEGWETGPWKAGEDYRTVDIASLVSSFVKRRGYAPGKYMGLKITPGPSARSDGYSRLYAAESFDGSQPPVLSIRLASN